VTPLAISVLRSLTLRALVIGACVVAAGPFAAAQPETPPALPVTQGSPGSTVLSACVKKPTAAASDLPPVTWSDFDVEGTLRESAETVRSLFTPVMTRYTSLTDDARANINSTAANYGYEVLGIDARESAKGTRAVIRLGAKPIVRKVKIDIKQSPFTTLLDDQVSRRMSVRVGTYLPFAAAERTCDLVEEQTRIAQYLQFEEGFFDATVSHDEELRDDGLEITMHIKLGAEYKPGKVTVVNADALSHTIDPREIVAQFKHDCTLCWQGARFSRTRYQEDVQHVVDLLQKRGFPAVRVHTDFETDPKSCFNRATHGVDLRVTVDPRRRLDLRFEGNDPDSVPEDQLREHLTFNEALSTDDVEATNSATSIAAWLQGRGWFDAHVTWTRERYQDGRDPQASFDRITFQIEQGEQRPVRRIEITGNVAFTDEQLQAVIGTTQEKLSTSLFGGNTNATSAQLAADVVQITQTYRRAGYRDVDVHVEATTDPSAYGSAALAAALSSADHGDGIYVHYAVDEGEPTLLTGVEVTLPNGTPAITTGEERRLCQMVLNELADLHAAKPLATLRGDRCEAQAPNLKFREDDAALTKDQLKDRLYNRGRPRAEVSYDVVETAPHRVLAKYKLANIQPLQIGKVVIRGNFRTRDSIILGELRLKEGAPLTQDALADSSRRLRNTSLFDAVRISTPDLETTNAGEVNAVVEVVERYDFRIQADVEAGYSSYNGAFVKLIPALKNLFGLGISFDLAGTLGVDLARYLEGGGLHPRQESLEATLRIPPWLSRRISPIEFQTELTAYHRLQDTPQFGELTTDGVTLILARTWERKRLANRAARALTVGIHYDFRIRERPIDVLRPEGADQDDTQVPVSTRTGSVGASFEWEQRVDRQGNLSPLAPDDGFHLESSASLASTVLGGQDTFIKVSAAGTKYWPVGANFLLRGDLRYDQGIPLEGAVLLPDVERFFAGGDATVRGYDDERLATEIIQVGVPPFTNGNGANLRQIRILPAGGNIRVMSSLDAQLRVYKFLASAVFVDAGMIANEWGAVTSNDIRPSVGIALVRILSPFGSFAFERAIPLHPQLGDDPRGRWHISFAARAQF
jgi:outer membrane protein assembly factor BamA